MSDEISPLCKDSSQNLSKGDANYEKPETAVVTQHGVGHVSQDMRALHLNEYERRSSESGARLGSTEGDSIVPDGGISRSLSVTRTKRRGRLYDKTEKPADIYEIHASGGSATSDEPETLADSIRSRMVKTDGGKNEFLPSDQVEELITIGSVSKELDRVGCARERLLAMAHSVVDIVPTERGMSSRQRIFAILCLQDKASEIGSFRDEGLYDEDLPFNFRNNTSREVLRIRDDGTNKIVQTFRKASWKVHELECFERSQGRMLAPCFEFSIGDNQKVLHYQLKSDIVLPFIQDIFDDHGAEAGPGLAFYREGGFSVVRKVEIHPAHHNDKSRTDSFFAVKELKVKKSVDATHQKEGDNEVLSLKRFNDKRHEHLIRLLATYTYKDRFHMVFPWANGNLKDFWKKIEPIRSPANAIWMARQILGLSRALRSIHFYEMDPNENPQDLPPEAFHKSHGRHGDLKPENILWFQSDQASDEDYFHGVLKIADFGFADFHGPDSKSNVRLSKIPGFTDTYKAPEAEGKRHISPQYDIWSLGCILLQFAIWWMWGWKGVDDFSVKRADEQTDPVMLIKADTFFKIQQGGKKTISLRTAVTSELDRIKQDENCSSFILELVQLIQTRLLRVKPDLRDTIDIIVNNFEEMFRHCLADTDYCMKRRKPPVEFSQEMSDIMEIPGSSSTSLDTNKRLSGMSDARSISPYGTRGPKTRKKTPPVNPESLGLSKRIQSNDSPIEGHISDKNLDLTSARATTSNALPGQPAPATSETNLETIQEPPVESTVRTSSRNRSSVLVEARIEQPKSNGLDASKGHFQAAQATFPNIPNAITPLNAEDTKCPIATEERSQVQNSRHPGRNSCSQEYPQRPEPVRQDLSPQMSKRKRFKLQVNRWVNSVLDRCLPDPKSPERPNA